MLNQMSGKGFQKISPEQFLRDIQGTPHERSYDEDLVMYEGIIIPKRATKFSAGYDFYFPFNDYELKVGESVSIPTGIRCAMDYDKVLFLMPRSSWGFKYRARLDNTVGVVDADYFNADNEGHIMCIITNEGDKDFVIKRGDRFMQGIFVPYFTFGEEVDTERIGGMGSTDEVK